MTLPWYPRDMGKYARDTKHLSMMEHGAFNLMLDYYYATGGLPNALSNATSNASLMPDHSRIHRLCGATTKHEQDAVDTVLSMFFKLDKDGFYRNEKADKVIAEQTLKHERRVSAGRKGGASKATSNATSNAPQNKKEIKKVDTNVSTPLPPKGGDGVPSSFLMPDGTFFSFDQLFERFWSNYPAIRDKGHKGKAKDELLKTLKEGTNYEIIGRGITKYRKYCDSTGEKQPDMFRWVRDKGWERDYAVSAAAPAATGRGAGHSLEAAVNQALADKTRRPEGRAERLKNLGLDDDSGNV